MEHDPLVGLLPKTSTKRRRFPGKRTPQEDGGLLLPLKQMAMGQKPVPPWVVHLPQNGTIGFDPQPNVTSTFFLRSEVHGLHQDFQPPSPALREVRVPRRAPSHPRTERVQARSQARTSSQEPWPYSEPTKNMATHDLSHGDQTSFDNPSTCSLHPGNGSDDLL